MAARARDQKHPKRETRGRGRSLSLSLSLSLFQRSLHNAAEPRRLPKPASHAASWLEMREKKRAAAAGVRESLFSPLHAGSCFDVGLLSSPRRFRAHASLTFSFEKRNIYPRAARRASRACCCTWQPPVPAVQCRDSRFALDSSLRYVSGPIWTMESSRTRSSARPAWLSTARAFDRHSPRHQSRPLSKHLT